MPQESIFQQEAIEKLKNLGYEFIPGRINLHGNSPKLDENFKKHIERLNDKALEYQKLSTDEFERIRNKYPKNPIDAFTKLRHGIEIVLDNNKRVPLNFIDKTNPDRNVYQVIEELTVVGLKDRRIDLLILINGVPIGNIELKKPGKSDGVQSAISQINQYTKDDIYKQDLLKFIQLFVVTNGIDTKYFCVDPNAGRGSRYGENVFTWMNDKNHFINRLSSFIEFFFDKSNFLEILFKYMLMMPLPHERIVIMRPSQIHAVKSCLRSVQRGIDCYVSSSTGSGKTLTSFKTGQELASEGYKTVVLLDRNDLADQTAEEFKKFDTTGLIQDIKKGIELHKALLDNEDKLIITTIQSMSKWLGKNQKIAKSLSDRENFVFIVDECHRSTSGEMFGLLKQTFLNPQRNILKCRLIGFTGTPLYMENAKREELTTASMFGDPAHIYTITEAIRDNTVLRFQVFEIELKTPKSIKKDESYFRNENRISIITDTIVHDFKNNTKQSDNVKSDFTRGFTAMFAADSKESAIRYYRKFYQEFKKQNRTTALVFSLDDQRTLKNLDDSEIQVYYEILKNHDADFRTNFASEFYSKPSEMRAAHVNDVINRAKKGQIDMLVVSDMLLTGFDANCVNTIYIDKSLKDHGILQAASRTNRLCGPDKEFGNIIFFSDRDMVGVFKEAIKLFGNADDVDKVVEIKKFSELEKETRKVVMNFKNLVPSPDDVMDIDTLVEFRKVRNEFSNVLGNISRIKVYAEWNRETGYQRIGISEDDIDFYSANIQLKRQEIDIKDPDGDSNADDDSFDFTAITHNGVVFGYRYILELLNNYVAYPPEERDRWLRRCEHILHNVNDPEIIAKKDAVLRVLDACRNDEIQNVDDLFNRLSEEMLAEQDKIISDFADEMNLPVCFVQDLLNYYNVHGKIIPRFDLTKQLKDKFDDTVFMGRKPRDFAVEIIENFKELVLKLG